MDGRWISPIVDLFCKLLTDYAIAADFEISSNKEIAELLKTEGEY